MSTVSTRHFDPVDLQQLRRLGRLPSYQRVRLMLDARELAAGLIRGRLIRRYPNLSPIDINLKLLEEISVGNRTHSRS